MPNLVGNFVLSLLPVFLQFFFDCEWKVSDEFIEFYYVIGEYSDQQKTEQETTNKHGNISDMSEKVWGFILMVCGGILSGGVGLFIASWQRRQDAASDFKIFISLKDGEIDAAKNATVFFNDTKSEIRDAVFRVTPLMWNTKKIRLRRVWNEYSKTTQADLIGHSYIRESLNLPVKTTVENPLEYLHKFMDRFLKAV